MSYQPGQVWTYKTRDEDAGSLLTVLRVENLPAYGVSVFVRVQGLQLKDMGAPDGIRSSIPFAAFTVGAMDKSVIVLVETIRPPDCQNFYTDWRKAFDSEWAAPSEQTIAEAVRTTQQLYDSRKP